MSKKKDSEELERSPVRAPVFKEAEVHFGVGKHQSQRLLLASHKNTAVLKEVLEEEHPSLKNFLKRPKNEYQTSNPNYLRTLINYEKQTGNNQRKPHAPLKAVQEYRNLRVIQDPRRVDKERDPFVTFEKPVPSAETGLEMDKAFCKFKLISCSLLLTCVTEVPLLIGIFLFLM